MKTKLFLLLAICITTNIIKAQDSIIKPNYYSNKNTKKIFRFEEELYVYFHRNIYFGDNFMADAHHTIFGLGLDLVPIKIYRFGLGFNYERSYQRVTNIAMAGNIKNTNSDTYQLNLIYNHELNEVIRIDPFIGIGNIDLIQRSPGQNFGKQNGTTWNIGSNILYRFNPNVSLFAGIAYRSAKMNVKTTEEFRPYFTEIKAIQFKFGIVLH